MQITINGKTCSCKPGKTIYEVARDNGFYIPVLCRHEQLRPSGSCRICSVELAGSKTFVASCCRPAEEGMEISTDSESVFSFRRLMIQLHLAQGSHKCEECASAGSCVLQRLAYDYSVERGHYATINPSGTHLDDANEMIVRDPPICVVCALFVQACKERHINDMSAGNFYRVRGFFWRMLTL
jgi:NADH dehydrogenase/NADH:ubiquinone oxidoreductase subunit G